MSARHGLLCLPCVENTQECLAAVIVLGRVADCNFSPAQSVFSHLGRGCSPPGRALTRAGTGYAATRCRGEAAAGAAVASLPAGLRLRNFMVCRHVLLDLQHHAAVRWRGDAGCPGAVISFLFVSCPLSRSVRLADRPAGKLSSQGWASIRSRQRLRTKFFHPPGALVVPVSLGRGRACPDPHHRIPLGLAGYHPGGQHSHGPYCHGDRCLRVVLRNHGSEYGAGCGVCDWQRPWST